MFLGQNFVYFFYLNHYSINAIIQFINFYTNFDYYLFPISSFNFPSTTFNNANSLIKLLKQPIIFLFFLLQATRYTVKTSHLICSKFLANFSIP